MILQALKEYYDRKAANPQSQMAPPGFEWKEIPFVVVLDHDGNPVGLNSTYEGTGKGRRAKLFLLPQAVKKASNIAANLLWGNPEYALGIPVKGKPERVFKQHSAFKERVEELRGITDPGLRAVRRFLMIADKRSLLEPFGIAWNQLAEEGANLSFMLAGETRLVAESQAIRSVIQSNLTTDSSQKGICLVTGQTDVLERLHTAIKGVWGAQSSGANIVSFNLDAFKSFGKDQGANAPVGRLAAFAYTTALNHLLGKDSTQRMQVGDASTVFWSEKQTTFEQQVVDFFGEPPKDDPDRNVRAVESLFKSIHTGAPPTKEEKARFYVLGLAPNASRIAIRFWIVDTVEGMSGRICEHFLDTEIDAPRDSPKWQSLSALLAATANETKFDNKKPNLVKYHRRYYDVKPNLEGDTMRAILEGLPYPQTLLHGALRRIRAEQAKKDKRTGKQLPNVTYERAALIKACINRWIRKDNPTEEKELIVSLDESNTNIGYRLGRLFATLEKIQQEANPSINATIRDRFYGAASSTPVAVFGTLVNRLMPHHLAKIESVRRRIYFEKLTARIMSDGIDGKIGFPAHLPLADQGRFAIGYYHQMQDFYTKKNDNKSK